MKVAFLFALVVMIFAAALGCVQPKSLPPADDLTIPRSEASPERELTAEPYVHARTLDYSNDYIDVNISYPEISGMRDEETQRTINDRVYSDLKSRAESIEAQAREAAQESRLRVVYSMDGGFSVERNDGEVLSVQIDISTYQGGANVTTDSAFINVINAEEAIQPSFFELFVTGADYKSVINEKIRAQIAGNPEKELFDFTTVSFDQWYYLTDTALVVVFPRYAITPGVYGEPEFVIPFDEISDILIPSVQ
jgi:hypothetical protein